MIQNCFLLVRSAHPIALGQRYVQAYKGSCCQASGIVICNLPTVRESSYGYYFTTGTKRKQENKSWRFCKAAWPLNTPRDSRP
jgi:hypothetical protein